jgi:hypothetical protein
MPDSIVRVGSVPFDSSYTHTMTFASASEQSAYFAGRCPNVMTNSVFIRPDQGQIQFKANSNDLYGCNYVMFFNPDNPKWWYAFVTDIQYVNDDVCRITFQIDVMQTWYFDYALSQCYVEREHVNDDTVGANLLDEPVSTGELKYAAQDILSNDAHPSTGLTTLVPIVFTAEEPYDNGIGGYSKRTSTGGWNNAVYSGCGMYVFKSGVLDEVNSFLNMLNMSGGGSAVSSVILFPASLIPDNWPSGSNVFKSFLQAQTKQVEWHPNVGARNGLDGYIPRNAKLYTYPYNFMRLTNFRGAYHDYRFEFFNDNTQPVFNVRGTPDPAADIMCQPKGYNGVDTNVEEQLTLGGLVQASWTYNSYQNWLAQNAGNNLLNLVSGAAMLIPAAKGIGWGMANAGKLQRARHSASVVSRESASSPDMGEIASAGLGINNLASLGANVFDASQQPDKAVGTVSNATVAGIGYGTFGAYRMCVRQQFAALIDQFFDMYGYTVQTVKAPNRTGRACWNYVKTRNATLHGDVPASDMSLINSIYDNGITFWHDGNVGDYNRANPIV